MEAEGGMSKDEVRAVTSALHATPTLTFILKSESMPPLEATGHNRIIYCKGFHHLTSSIRSSLRYFHVNNFPVISRNVMIVLRKYS